MNFFVFVKKFMPNGYIIEISKWGFILTDFMGFSFNTSKVISPYYISQYGFSPSFKRFHI